MLTAALSIWYLCRTKAVKLTKESFVLQKRVVGRSLSLGVCSFLSQISLVAAMAAVNKIVISVAIGMAAGCIPIVGYNMGAGHRGRVKKLFALLLGAEAFVGFLSLLIVEGFPRQLIAVFGASGESVYYTEFAVRAFRVYLCMIVLACINKAAFIFCRRWEGLLPQRCCP